MSVTKEVTFKPEFGAIFGLNTGTRASAVKAVWDYATKNGLKSTRLVPTKEEGKSRNAAVILADANLKSLFGDSEFYGVGEIAKGISANVQ